MTYSDLYYAIYGNKHYNVTQVLNKILRKRNNLIETIDINRNKFLAPTSSSRSDKNEAMNRILLWTQCYQAKQLLLLLLTSPLFIIACNRKLIRPKNQWNNFWLHLPVSHNIPFIKNVTYYTNFNRTPNAFYRNLYVACGRSQCIAYCNIYHTC